MHKDHLVDKTIYLGKKFYVKENGNLLASQHIIHAIQFN
jgi:hypothetical protein